MKSHGVCDSPYRLPGSRLGRAAIMMVDRNLDHVVLDRLNLLSGLWVSAVCSGHARGPGDREAHVIFLGRTLESFRDPLMRLSATEYQAHVSYYNATWHLEVRRERRGSAPLAWWQGLLDLLEGG